MEEQRDKLPTPYYLIDESRLLLNMRKIEQVRNQSGAKCVLALKCFSTWSVFDFMRPYLDGTTSSSLFEARLGHEKFGKEVHAYSVAFSDSDVEEIKTFATKIIFNSISQLKRFYADVSSLCVGLRVNPGLSYSHFDLADPARRYSRLGESDLNSLLNVSSMLSGIMFHFNCENDDFEKLSMNLNQIGKMYEPLLKKLQWVSLGGGLYFTKEGYPLDRFCDMLSDWARKYDVQIYLEPGETAVTGAGYLVTKVLDIVQNEIDIAIVDSAVETHMLDLMIYQSEAKLELPTIKNGYTYMIAGKTCLAGDIFGTYVLPNKLKVGGLIPFSDAAGYTMVKKNWFNGVSMPSIAIRRIDGRIDVIRQFSFEDYISSLS